MISQCWKWKILLDRSHFLNPSLLWADIYPNNTWHTLKWKKNPLIVQNLHLQHFSALENFQKFSKISIIIKNFKFFKQVVAYRIFSRISFTVIFLMFQNEKQVFEENSTMWTIFGGDDIIYKIFKHLHYWMCCKVPYRTSIMFNMSCRFNRKCKIFITKCNLFCNRNCHICNHKVSVLTVT